MVFERLPPICTKGVPPRAVGAEVMPGLSCLPRTRPTLIRGWRHFTQQAGPRGQGPGGGFLPFLLDLGWGGCTGMRSPHSQVLGQCCFNWAHAGYEDGVAGRWVRRGGTWGGCLGVSVTDKASGSRPSGTVFSASWTPVGAVTG